MRDLGVLIHIHILFASHWMIQWMTFLNYIFLSCKYKMFALYLLLIANKEIVLL